MKKIKVGIIGCGRIGRLHAENITSYFRNVQFKTVCDLSIDNTKNWADDLDIKNVCVDFREVIEDPEIKAVFVCSSSDTHAKFIIACAEAGKHIFCEKPIALDIDRIKEALSSVEKAGVKLQIGFNRRFDRNFKKVYDTIKSGKIGKPHILKITSRDPAPPPADYIKGSGGIFLDMTIHDFDMARFLIGSEVEEVYASGAVLIDPAIGEAGDVDTAAIVLKFKNGAIGLIDNSRQAVYGYDQRVEVFGSKGCISAANEFPNNAVLLTEETVSRDKPVYFFLERYKESFIEEARQFFDALIKNTATPVNGNDGLQAVIIGLAARRSLLEGRPVRIDCCEVKAAGEGEEMENVRFQAKCLAT